ncbi:MAG: hypothetical protein ACOH2R_05185 [Pseudomonas sp.]
MGRTLNEFAGSHQQPKNDQLHTCKETAHEHYQHHRLPADELMLPGYFGFLAAVATLDLPASNAITRQALGWDPVQPGLIEDLDNGHYFAPIELS